MKTSVNTHKHFLTALHVLKPKFRKGLIKACNDEEINCICECIYNVLQGKIPIAEGDRIKLNKHKNILRKLITKGKNNLRKHIIIQKGGAFLPIILGSIINALLGTVV